MSFTSQLPMSAKLRELSKSEYLSNVRAIQLLGEMQRITFRLMLSSCVCVCVCLSVCVSGCVCVCVCRVCGPHEIGLR